MNLHDVIKLARENLAKHQLYNWQFILQPRPIHRLGICYHKRKIIALSAHHALYSPDNGVIDTLQHEIAHAIVGACNRHNDVWKAKAVELGATPTACSQVYAKHPKRWRALCPYCLVVWLFNRRNRGGYICRDCHRFTKAVAVNPEYLIYKAKLYQEMKNVGD